MHRQELDRSRSERHFHLRCDKGVLRQGIRMGGAQVQALHRHRHRHSHGSHPAIHTIKPNTGRLITGLLQKGVQVLQVSKVINFKSSIDNNMLMTAITWLS